MRLLVDAETPVVTIFGKTWLLHVREVLQTTPDENLAMIEDTVRYLTQQGRLVVYDAEHAFDGYKDDPEYALATWQAAERGGADIVVLCDTNGGSVPAEIARDHAGGARAASASGSASTRTTTSASASPMRWRPSRPARRHVQGTFNGYGERIGNCNLTTLIPNLAFKLKKTSVPAESLPLLKELSQFLDEVANVRPNPRLPWVGSAAFSHKGGTHVNAVQKLLRSYEHIDPALVGNSRQVLISELAGPQQHHHEGAGARVRRHEGHARAERDADARQGARARRLRVRGGRRIARAAHPAGAQRRADAVSRRRLPRVDAIGGARPSVCEATVKVRVGHEHAHTVADGDGPVNALDGALRSALVRFYPDLQTVRLTDYKVRIVDSSVGTAARTRVLIESSDGTSTWTTIGVNENIIEASLQALVDSLEYGLLKKEFTANVGRGRTG